MDWSTGVWVRGDSALYACALDSKDSGSVIIFVGDGIARYAPLAFGFGELRFECASAYFFGAVVSAAV